MKNFLKSRNIEAFGAVLLKDCKIIKKYLLEKNGISDNACVLMMLLPYRSEQKPKNLSVYASVPDYHKLVDELRAEMYDFLKGKGISAPYALFADHSPIDEVHASCIAGLGFIGDNGLLINERYSSFVFLCELIIDADPGVLGLELVKNAQIKHCLGCGACARACPSNCMDKSGPAPKSECLSAITQKKGELTSEEKELMLQNNTLWGCDICQNVCPYTRNAEYTKIEYFKNGIITELTTELIENMSDEELSSRAFSWRGRGVLLRNLQIFGK